MASNLPWACAAIALLGWQQAACAPSSIEGFAARSRIEGVAISPDGKYLSLIQTQHGTAAVVVLERQRGASATRAVVLSEPGNYHLSWCRWATNKRRPISYPARDGTKIPGYLSLPAGPVATGLPLIVMPHGGPIARDNWGYFFLRQFLVSRGYAVLQMNFRGSSGFGSSWQSAAHQDWGGLSYDDVVDGARWAIAQGTADPARVCIVGWSFGGYLALIGTQRNGDIFHCAVSIAGVSDLRLAIDESYDFDHDAVRAQIGTDTGKLTRDSPRLHAAEFQVPVLLLHGDRDVQSPLEQSQAMDLALARAGKPHRLVAVHGADHAFSAEAARATLLKEVEDFLRQNIGPGPAP